MSDALQHHGIRGMKWGVRRTPEQLGHKTNYGSGSKTATKSKDESRGSRKKRHNAMTDEEMRSRIERLKLEKTYDELLSEQKKRNTGTISKIAGEAFERFGKGLLNKAVDTALEKMFDKDGKFDIDEWRNADVNTMDERTIKKVTEWYKDADTLTQKRRAVKNRESDAKKDNDSSRSTPESKTNTNGNDSSPAKSDQPNSSKKIPWAYRKAGTADQKEQDKINRTREKRDKKEYKWIG